METPCWIEVVAGKEYALKLGVLRVSLRRRSLNATTWRLFVTSMLAACYIEGETIDAAKQKAMTTIAQHLGEQIARSSAALLDLQKMESNQ